VDYNESRLAILPEHVFTGLVWEQSGIGAGTVVRVTMAAPGVTHTQYPVPMERSARITDMFNHSKDKLREETLARQKKLGVI
jgi:hypothetical protein